MLLRPQAHWSPRYVSDRVALARYRRAHPDAPWFPRPAVEFLDRWLRPTDVGIEFGSGHSTKWFAQRMEHLTSVEDDEQWYATVREEIETHHVDYRLATDRASYLRIAEEFAPDSLDFALVDGSWRDECAAGILPAIRPGGVLVIDDASWFMSAPYAGATVPHQLTQRTPAWDAVAASLSEWRQVWTTDGVTHTAFFVRPA